MAAEKKNKNPDKNPSPSLWDQILSFLGLGDNEDREKKQFLKEIKKSIKHSRYKFLKIPGDLVQPAFAKLFHELYKIIGPAQSLLQNAKSSEAIKTIVIESQLPADQIEAIGLLNKDKILEKANLVPVKELGEEVKKILVDLNGAFTMERVKKINHLYNTLLVFLDFLDFNYFFMLKKFDAGLPDKDFGYLPRFESISASYILEDLKDFLEVFYFVSINLPWEEVFDVLKYYKDVEVVPRDSWRKILSNLENIRKSGIFLDMIRHLDQNPYYKVAAKPPNEKILEPFLESLRVRTETTLSKIQTEKRNNKKNQLVQAIFGTAGVSRTKNYTEKGHLAYSKKNLPGFVYVEPLNYLKAFLLDYYKRDIRELVNLLLVKGEWTSPAISQPFSDAFHQLMSFSDEINDFDESLAEDGDKGQKLKTMIYRVDRDANAAQIVSGLLKDINDRALDLITRGGASLIVVGKNLKALLDDQAKTKHDVLFNWKALEMASQKGLRDWIAEVYKTIYYFIQLMQFYVKSK